MIFFILGIIIYCALGSFAGGIALHLNRCSVNPDPFLMAMMVFAAPLTVLYVIGHVTMILGIRLAHFYCKN